jgi:hypothetical protein
MSVHNISQNFSKPSNFSNEAFYLSQATIDNNNNNCRPSDFIDQFHELRDQGNDLFDIAARDIVRTLDIDVAIDIANRLESSIKPLFNDKAYRIYEDYQRCSDDPHDPTVASAFTGVRHIYTAAVSLHRSLRRAKQERQERDDAYENAADFFRTSIMGILGALNLSLGQEAYGH